MTDLKSPEQLRHESLLRAAKVYYELGEEKKECLLLARRLVQRAFHVKQRIENG